MIISRIIGGLGNQLFQYAAGKSLALQHGTELKLDVSGYDAYKLRNFDLQAFDTACVFAGSDEIKHFTSRSFAGKIRDHLFPYQWRRVYKPRHFHFSPGFFNLPPEVYLQGYWQSEKFFLPFSNEIRKAFTLREEFIRPVAALSHQLKNEAAVSVHIRRGDYKNELVQKVHGILEKEYYLAAMQRIKEIVPEARFYFFSDDIQWVKENLAAGIESCISGIHTRTHFEDFYLMSQCRHHIIANSSFSWWAAWLNKNPDKTVIGPRNWFNEGPKDTYDLFPETWIAI